MNRSKDITRLGLTILGLLLIAGPGRAYTLLGMDWNRLGGSPISVSFYINPNCNDSTAPDVLTSLQSAMNSWSNAGASFVYNYADLTSSVGPARNDSNEVSWSSNSGGALATATIWGDPSVSQIWEVDVVFWEEWIWNTNWPTGDQYDVESVGLHELGHALGLDHSQFSDAVMWHSIGSGEVKRELQQDDIRGINFIYGDRFRFTKLAQLRYDAINDVDVSGNYAYVADDVVLRILDISDPSSPLEVGNIRGPGPLWDLAVSGSYAYVATHYAGVWVVDISNPGQPVEAGLAGLGARRLAISGSYAYYTLSIVGPYLYVLNISNPDSMFYVGQCRIASFSLDLAYSANYVYVPTQDSGMQVVDVSNPAAPFAAGSYYYNRPVSRCEEVAVVGTYAYVACAGAGLRIVDVSDPSNPFEVGVCDTTNPWEEKGVAVSGNLAFVGYPGQGMRAVDISDPTAPFAVGYFAGSPGVHNLAVCGNYVYGGTNNGDFAVYLFTGATPVETVEATNQPKAFSLAGAFPNPFNSATNIHYSLPRGSNIRLEVYNLRGQHLETLFEGQPQTGEHWVIWDASDYASGIYFYRLTAGDFTETRKMMLVK